MSIRIGDIDVTNGIIDTEFRITVLEKVIDRLLRVAPPGTITDKDIEKFRDESIEILQKKYPSAGITKKG